MLVKHSLYLHVSNLKFWRITLFLSSIKIISFFSIIFTYFVFFFVFSHSDCSFFCFQCWTIYGEEAPWSWKRGLTMTQYNQEIKFWKIEKINRTIIRNNILLGVNLKFCKFCCSLGRWLCCPFSFIYNLFPLIY